MWGVGTERRFDERTMLTHPCSQTRQFCTLWKTAPVITGIDGSGCSRLTPKASTICRTERPFMKRATAWSATKNNPMTTPKRFNLTLEAAPRRNDPAGHRRLRLALKALRRSYGLRCLRVEPQPVDNKPASPKPPA